jgi:RNA polymerase sigma factor (sigma-70 family)
MPATLTHLLHRLRRLTALPAADSDRVLLDRFARRRDEEAFAALVARHGPMVLNVCRRVLGEAPDAEDAFQATFLVLAKKAHSLGRPAALAGWLHGVARRVALKARTARGRRASTGLTGAPEPPDPRPDPLAALTARDLLAALEEEVARLPEVYRLAVVLVCLEGLSQEEAAQRLGCTAGAVKGRLERGRRRLHERLAKRGLTLPAALAAVEVARAAAGVRPELATATARAAAALAAGEPGAACGLSAKACELAEGALPAAGMGKAKLVVVLALALGAVALGVGALRDPPQEQQPAGASPAGGAARPKAGAGKPPGTDRHGDPLPPGAIARLGTLRFRGVRGCLAFSPNGKQLAAATEPAGAVVTLYDTATGRAGRRFPTPATLTRVAFAPDGKRLACSDNSSRSQVLDVATGKQLFAAAGSHAAFADGGKTLVTADGYGAAPQVRVLDAGTGRLLRAWPTTKARVKAGPFDQGAVEMAVASSASVLALIDRTALEVVQIRDLATGATTRSIRLAGEGSQWLALAPDGKTLATASRSSVRLWDTTTGKEVRGWKQRADGPPVFMPSGQGVAWTGYDERKGIARVWAGTRADAAPKAVGPPVNNFQPPCFSPDGKVLAVVTDGHAVQLRRVADGKEVRPLDAHDGPVYGLAFTADGRHVVSRARDGVLAWEALSGRLLRRSAGGEVPGESLAGLLPDGRLLTAQRTADPTISFFRVREAPTGREVLRVQGRPDAGQLTVAPGGRYAGLGGERDGGFSVLDLRTGRWRYRLDPREAHFEPKLSADGDVLAWHPGVVGAPEVHVRRHPTGKVLVVKGLPQNMDRARSRMSPDGRWLVVVGEEGPLRRWDLAAGKEAPPLAGAQRTVWEVLWSPDGRLVLARGSAAARTVIDRRARRDVRAWDADSGRRLTHLDLEGAPSCLLFAPDGRTLLTADREEIRLREVATGQERARLRGHVAAWVTALAASADGRLLASGGDDAQVLVWDLTGRAPDGRWRTARQRPEQLAAAWEALAGADARAAYAALWQLAADPEGATALLGQRLRPAPVADGKQLERLLGELNSGKFAVRDRANEELDRLGEMAEPALRKVLKGDPSEELRRRVRKLLQKLEAVPLGERLRELRAVEVLERVGTAGARQVLERLAGGAPEARLTREARTALGRLGGRQKDPSP